MKKLTDYRNPSEILQQKELQTIFEDQIKKFVGHGLRSTRRKKTQDYGWFIMYSLYWENKPEKEIAKKLKVSSNRINQIKNKILMIMRHPNRVSQIQDYERWKTNAS